MDSLSLLSRPLPLCCGCHCTASLHAQQFPSTLSLTLLTEAVLLLLLVTLYFTAAKMPPKQQPTKTSKPGGPSKKAENKKKEKTIEVRNRKTNSNN